MDHPALGGGCVSPWRAGRISAAMVAGPWHPPFRRKKFRSAPSPPGGEDCARFIPSSSPHKIFDFAGAPVLFPKKKRECAVHGGREKKKGTRRGTRGAPVVRCLSTNIPARGVVRAGAGGRRMDSFLFPLALPRRIPIIAPAPGQWKCLPGAWHVHG